MTEFIGNEDSAPVNIELTLEPDTDDQGDPVIYLGIGVEDHNGDRTIHDWITDEPDAIDEWFAATAKLHAEWNKIYHGIEPVHGHIVPLGPGNSNAGTR